MPTAEEMQMMAAQQEPSMGQAMQAQSPEAIAAVMQPDPEIKVIMLIRLEQLSREELQLLDKIIDGNSARVLLKILPELNELIEVSTSRKAAGGGQLAAAGGGGALAGM